MAVNFVQSLQEWITLHDNCISSVRTIVNSQSDMRYMRISATHKFLTISVVMSLPMKHIQVSPPFHWPVLK
jgi:hypothetical protein